MDITYRIIASVLPRGEQKFFYIYNELSYNINYARNRYKADSLSAV
jgi:hypothetical protein